VSRSSPRWHRGSLFGDGPRQPLDREKRARFRFLHRAARRLIADYVTIGEALLRRLGADGQCDPSYATLAADTGSCDRTARRATAAMRDIGLLRWERRLVRRGWRAEQTSNSYELVPSAVAPVLSSGGQSVREIPLKSNPTTTTQTELALALAALEARRVVAEGRLLLRTPR
jgi:hypothetical protein